MTWGIWLNQGVSRLQQKGHSLRDISEYTLLQFSTFLEAIEQLDASARTGFVTDVTVVLGSVLAGSKSDNMAQEHMDLLVDTVLGAINGGQQT